MTVPLFSLDTVPPEARDSLKGDPAGQWAVTVYGNWRIVFRFAGAIAAVMDVVDYQ